MHRKPQTVLLAMLLLSLFSVSVSSLTWVPLSPAEGEAVLAEAVRFATVTWQVGDEVFTGVPYSWGGRTDIGKFLTAVEQGANPDQAGVDASGLVIAAFQSLSPELRFRIPSGDGFTLSLNINSSLLYQYNVVPVAVEELLPGDLIFFGSGGRIDGVGIYERTVGRHVRFIVASANSGKVVSTSANLDGEYWATRFAGAGRLLRSEPE